MASMLDAQRTGIGGLAKLGEGVRANSDARTQAGLGRGPNQSKKLINAAWTDTFPAQGATLDLDFANNRGFVRGIGQGKSMDAVTFTRASNGNYVKPDGTLSSHANQGALGNNLLTFPQDFDNAAWGKSQTSVNINVETAPNGTNTGTKLFATVSANAVHLIQRLNGVPSGEYTFSVYAKKAEENFIIISYSLSHSVGVNLTDGSIVETTGSGATSSVIDAGDGWWKIVLTATVSTTSNANIYISKDGILANRTYIGDGTSGIFIWGAQLELGSTATEYFPTNIGQPRFDWASTASTGAGTIASPYVIPLAANPTSNGLLIEEARTNRILWCRDATQANWVKTNVTAAKDQTGIDGVANAASSLTATANDGTCIQTITLASGSRTGSVYLKRLTGTGNVQVSLDGSTWSTVDLSTDEWRRIVLSGTVTNPTVGIKLAVSGDAVAMDYGQVEDGVFATTPILTTTATATRADEVFLMSGKVFNAWYNVAESTVYGKIKNLVPDNGVGTGTLNNSIFTFIQSSTNYIRIGIGNTSSRVFRLELSARVLSGFIFYVETADFAVPQNETVEICASFSNIDSNVKLSSQVGQETTAGFMPIPIENINDFDICGTRGQKQNAYICRVTYFPKSSNQIELNSIREQNNV